jgi:hypothetical protein
MLPARRRVRRLTILPIRAVAVLVVWPGPVGAQVVSDPALRAAYLFNFAKFIEWPEATADVTTPLRVCSTDARVAEALIALVAGKTINGRAVTGARVSPVDGLRGCAIVHAGNLNDRDSKTVLATLAGQPTFAIGDSDRFTAIGGAAHFYLERGRLRFAINLDVVRRVGLRIDPGLLQMAQIIKTPAGGTSR